MKRWRVMLGLCVLMLAAACGGNATIVPLPTDAPPATVPMTSAIPTETAVASTPTTVSTAPLTTQAIALLATATGAATPTATASVEPTNSPSPTNTLSPTNTPLPASSPTLPAPTEFHGDANNGAALFVKMGCKSCHMPPPKAKRIAPDLSHILADADEFMRRPDYHGTATDAESYIRESILLPNIFVVPAYRYLTRDGSSIMPLDFGERLSPAEIDDLVAYVLTQP